MSRRFIIVVEDATKEQKDTITNRIKGLEKHGYGYWHRMENMWLVTQIVETVTPKSFCTWLEKTPGIDKLTYIVFEVNGESPYWGRGNKESWDWMSESWGEVII